MKDGRGRDIMRAMLTLLLLGAFQVALFWLFQYEVPQGNRDLVVFMLGQLSTLAGMGAAYWLGTSKSSQDKTGLLKDQLGHHGEPQPVTVTNDRQHPVPTDDQETVTPARAPLPVEN